MATGLIVGESLMGVVYAGAVAGAEKAGSATAPRAGADPALFGGDARQPGRVRGVDRRTVPLDQGARLGRTRAGDDAAVPEPEASYR